MGFKWNKAEESPIGKKFSVIYRQREELIANEVVLQFNNSIFTNAKYINKLRKHNTIIALSPIGEKRKQKTLCYI